MNTLYLERSASTGRNGAWVDELALDPAPERIVVGTGPGSFAGIRAALAFAQGYALGRGCEVFGLPSPCAVAAQAYAREPSLGDTPLAVLGDARRGKIWIALFRGYVLEKDIFQVDSASLVGSVPEDSASLAGSVPEDSLAGSVPEDSLAGSVPQDSLAGSVPQDCKVVTVDEGRIGSVLKATFGDRYLGGQTPTAEGLRAFAEANPAILKSEPLPIYLNPAVRN